MILSKKITVCLWIVLAIGIGFALIPSVAVNAAYLGDNGQPAGKEGLVPCGSFSNNPCQLTDVFSIIIIITNFLIGLGGIIAVVAIAYAGFSLATAAGSIEAVTAAKKLLVNAVIGFFLVMVAFAAANLLIFGGRGVITDEPIQNGRPAGIFVCPIDYILGNPECGGGGGGSANNANNAANNGGNSNQNTTYEDDDLALEDGRSHELGSCDDTPSTAFLDIFFKRALAQRAPCDVNAYISPDCKKTYSSQAELKPDLETISIKFYDFAGNYTATQYLANDVDYVEKTRTLTLHKCVAQKAKAAFDQYYTYAKGIIMNVPSRKNEITPIKNVGGQVPRNSTTGGFSAHRYGVAIDINSGENANYRRGYLSKVKVKVEGKWKWERVFIPDETRPWVRSAGNLWRPCHTPKNWTLVSYYGTRQTRFSDLGQTVGDCNPYSINPKNKLASIFAANAFGWGGRWEGIVAGNIDPMHFSGYRGEYGDLYDK